MGVGIVSIWAKAFAPNNKQKPTSHNLHQKKPVPVRLCGVFKTNLFDMFLLDKLNLTNANRSSQWDVVVFLPGVLEVFVSQ